MEEQLIMQHDYSMVTQGLFATLFGLFALVGPVIGVTFSDSFGVRSQIAADEKLKRVSLENKIGIHEKFFCSKWAGDCEEQQFRHQVNRLIN
tara:strand:- start:1058 stop:1333 length:276 start_codon:yes stop_codon:yes gene_type:complete